MDVGGLGKRSSEDALTLLMVQRGLVTQSNALEAPKRIQGKTLATVVVARTASSSRMRATRERSVRLEDVRDEDDGWRFWGAVHALIAKSQIQFSVIPYFISSITRQA
jgi:hypothetical protein